MLRLWSVRVVPAFFNSLEVPERSCDCTASEADRPLTLKNQLNPGFSRVLAPSDSDSADLSSEFVLFCPTSFCLFWLRAIWYLMGRDGEEIQSLS